MVEVAADDISVSGRQAIFVDGPSNRLGSFTGGIIELHPGLAREPFSGSAADDLLRSAGGLWIAGANPRGCCRRIGIGLLSRPGARTFSTGTACRSGLRLCGVGPSGHGRWGGRCTGGAGLIAASQVPQRFAQAFSRLPKLVDLALSLLQLLELSAEVLAISRALL